MSTTTAPAPRTPAEALDDIRWAEDRQAAKDGIAADEAALTRKRSVDQARAALGRLGNIEIANRGRDSIGDSFRDRSNYLATLRHNLDDIDTLNRADALFRTREKTHVSLRERGVYENGEHSELADLLLAGSNDIRSGEASRRLTRAHKERVSTRASDMERTLRSTVFRRTADERKRATEVRTAMDTGSSSGFTAPAFDVQDYGISRSYPPTFLTESVKVEDPGHGMILEVPVLTAVATTSQQATENTAVADSSPTGGYRAADLQTVAGEVEASVQLLERSGPVAFDKAVRVALIDSWRASVDSLIAAAVVSAGGSISGASSFTAAGLYQDVAEAKAAVATDAGVRLPTTHIVTQPAFADWLLAASDPAGRPLALPANVVTTDIPPAAGHTGSTLLSVGLYTDGNLSFSGGGSEATIVVANMGEVFVLVSPPVFRVAPEPTAASFTTVLQLWGYTATVVRHPNAVQVLTGGAYQAQPSFL